MNIRLILIGAGAVATLILAPPLAIMGASLLYRGVKAIIPHLGTLAWYIGEVAVKAFYLIREAMIRAPTLTLSIACILTLSYALHRFGLLSPLVRGASALIQKIAHFSLKACPYHPLLNGGICLFTAYQMTYSPHASVLSCIVGIALRFKENDLVSRFLSVTRNDYDLCHQASLHNFRGKIVSSLITLAALSVLPHYPASASFIAGYQVSSLLHVLYSDIRKGHPAPSPPLQDGV